MMVGVIPSDLRPVSFLTTFIFLGLANPIISMKDSTELLHPCSVSTLFPLSRITCAL